MCMHLLTVCCIHTPHGIYRCWSLCVCVVACELAGCELWLCIVCTALFVLPKGAVVFVLVCVCQVYKDVVEPLESVSVTITPTDKKDVSEFGDVADVRNLEAAAAAAHVAAYGHIAAATAATPTAAQPPGMVLGPRRDQGGGGAGKGQHAHHDGFTMCSLSPEVTAVRCVCLTLSAAAIIIGLPVCCKQHEACMPGDAMHLAVQQHCNASVS